MSALPTKTNVLIAERRPTGLALATTLARAGIGFPGGSYEESCSPTSR